jgi:hypothetical protein
MLNDYIPYHIMPADRKDSSCRRLKKKIRTFHGGGEKDMETDI